MWRGAHHYEWREARSVPDGVIAALRVREVAGLLELPKPPQLRRGDPVRVITVHLRAYGGMSAKSHASPWRSCCSSWVIASASSFQPPPSSRWGACHDAVPRCRNRVFLLAMAQLEPELRPVFMERVARPSVVSSLRARTGRRRPRDPRGAGRAVDPPAMEEMRAAPWHRTSPPSPLRPACEPALIASPVRSVAVSWTRACRPDRPR